MSSRFLKKSLVSACGLWVRTPYRVCPTLALSTRRPPTRTVISGAVSVSNCARSTSSASAGDRVSSLLVISKAVGERLERSEGIHIGLLLRSVHAPGREGNG